MRMVGMLGPSVIPTMCSGMAGAGFLHEDPLAESNAGLLSTRFLEVPGRGCLALGINTVLKHLREAACGMISIGMLAGPDGDFTQHSHYPSWGHIEHFIDD